MTEDSVAVGLSDTGSGKGLLSFDYDEDGDLDLFVVNNVSGGMLQRNDGGNTNDWLQVEAVGGVSTTRPGGHASKWKPSTAGRANYASSAHAATTSLRASRPATSVWARHRAARSMKSE